MGFEEVQRFRQRWLVALLVGTALLVLYPLGNFMGPISVLVQVLVLGAIALVLGSRLETRVEGDAVSVKFFPFHLSPRRFDFKEIKEFSAEEYSPVKEFGGWGLRWRPFAGKVAYNVSGDQGVRLEMSDGREVMIGSKRPEELEKAIGEEIK